MDNKRWLNIVVDGNKALEQYWSDIVSNYLEKIVRCFIGDNQEQESYLGLVFYNANSELVEAGYDMQFINWTKDVNKYMETLSSLSFNGNDLNQSSMAEGLAEALVMYPKPCDTMTEREYYNAERHCILVAPGDPSPKKMAVCLPMIQRAQVIGQRLQACQLDFLEVAQKCVPLAVSLSVITPNPVPIFGAIFNLGNNVLTLSNAPISSYSTGQLTILLSKNFKEAHIALKEKRIVEFPSTPSTGSVSAEPDTTLFRVLSTNLQEEQPSSVASEQTIKENINEACNVLTQEMVSTSQPFDSQELIYSKGVDQANVASAGTQIPINLYEDIMDELNSDRDLFTSNKRSKTFSALVEDNDLMGFFELDQNPFDGFNDSIGQDQEISIEKQTPNEAVKEVENELEEFLHGATKNTSKDQTSNVELATGSSKEVNVPPIEVQAPPSNIVEGSSIATGLLHETTLQSWYNPLSVTNTSTFGMTNTSTVDFQKFQASVSSANFTFPSTTGSSQSHVQPNSSQNQFSMGNLPGQLPMGQHFQAYNQYLRNNMTPLNPPVFGGSSWNRSMPSLSPSYPVANLYDPSIDDVQNYVHTWEGNLAGKIITSRLIVIRAKAYRKATTPISLTLRWTGRMEISILIPQKAVNHTKKFSQPMDYVFFHVPKCKNVDLYKHLKDNNLCAKIDLQYQAITLSPTEREHFFLGTVFTGDTLFIEPA